MVDREKSVDGGGVAAARRAPQARGVVRAPPEGSAGKVSTAGPRQPSTVPVAGEGVGAVEGAQPALAGAQGLPAGGGGQGLTLCKETADLLLTGELGEDRGVPQHTHVQRLLCLHHLLLGAVADQRVAVRQAQVEGDQRAVLHAQRAQSRAVDLRCEVFQNEPICDSP